MIESLGKKLFWGWLHSCPKVVEARMSSSDHLVRSESLRVDLNSLPNKHKYKPSWFHREGPEWLADYWRHCQKSASRMSYPCSLSRQGLKPDWSTASLARRSSREPLPRCMERSVIPPPLSGCICLLAQERTSCYTHAHFHLSCSFLILLTPLCFSLFLSSLLFFALQIQTVFWLLS